MGKNETLRQHESVAQAIEAGNKIFLSGSHMIVFGILVLLVPVIELGSSYLSFGIGVLRYPSVNAIIHVVFYWVLFRTAHYIVSNKKEHQKTSNPAIKKALTVCMPILVSIFGSVIALLSSGYDTLVCPIALLFSNNFQLLLRPEKNYNGGCAY